MAILIERKRLIDEHRCHSVYLDVGSNIGVQIRKAEDGGIFVVAPLEESPAWKLGIQNKDVIVSVDSNTWKGIILKSESAARAIASGKLRIDGESIKFLQFSALFVND